MNCHYLIYCICLHGVNSIMGEKWYIPTICSLISTDLRLVEMVCRSASKLRAFLQPANTSSMYLHYTLYPKKNIPDIFNCNLKTSYQILIIFDMNIPDTTCHQMTIQFPTSPNVCFCTTWGKPNQRNITFLSNAI